MTKRTIENLLDKLYYSVDNPGAYGGVNPLLLAVNLAAGKKVDRGVVTDWLSKQDTYTLHRPAKEKFPRNKTLSKGIDYAWQADLVEMQPLASRNEKYRYLLTVVDTFSRYAWVRPIKNKTGPEIVRALSSIFRQGRKPQKLCTDMGKEFTNKVVQEYLNEQSVFHYTLASDTKASIVERFNRTLKERMWRYFTHNNTRRYLEILPPLLNAYNNRKHYTLGIAPISVTKRNERSLWNRLYGEEKATKIHKFNLGDRVRLSIGKAIFKKGYSGYWTKEIFTIKEVITNKKLPMYLVEDKSGETIKGSYYDNQLQRVSE